MGRHRYPRILRHGFNQLGVGGGFGKNGGHLGRFHLIDQGGEGAWGRLLLGAEAAEGSRHLKPVGVSKVAKGIVGGHQPPLGRGHRRHLGLNPIIDLVELGYQASGVLSVAIGLVGVNLGQALGNHLGDRAVVGRTVPNVGIRHQFGSSGGTLFAPRLTFVGVLIPMGMLTLVGMLLLVGVLTPVGSFGTVVVVVGGPHQRFRHRLFVDRHPYSSGRAVLDHANQTRHQTIAVVENQVSLLNGLAIGGLNLVGVGVGTGAEQAGEGYGGLGNLLGQIANHPRGGHDPRAVGLAPGGGTVGGCNGTVVATATD